MVLRTKLSIPQNMTKKKTLGNRLRGRRPSVDQYFLDVALICILVLQVTWGFVWEKMKGGVLLGGRGGDRHTALLWTFGIGMYYGAMKVRRTTTYVGRYERKV